MFGWNSWSELWRYNPMRIGSRFTLRSRSTRLRSRLFLQRLARAKVAVSDTVDVAVQSASRIKSDSSA